jgi:hypothetical protein
MNRDPLRLGLMALPSVPQRESFDRIDRILPDYGLAADPILLILSK